MKIFLISPVRKADPEIQEKIAEYVRSLEEAGNSIHWPCRDTEQEDSEGGINICRTNFEKILEADEVHIWYDEASGGSKFDMGGVFMLFMLGLKKKVRIANDGQIEDNAPKSFYKVFKTLVEE